MDEQNFSSEDANDATFFLQDEEEPSIFGGGVTTANEEYGDMNTEEALEADDIDDEAVDKYLNAELI